MRPDLDGDGVPDALPANVPAHQYTYHVTFYTMDVAGAGTNADISVGLNGKEGFIGLQVIPTPKQALERGSQDTFTLSGVDCGELISLEVAVTPRGLGLKTAWKLDKIEVTRNEITYTFPGPVHLTADQPRARLTTAAVADAEAAEVRATHTEPWTIAIHTGGKLAGGTDAVVRLAFIDQDGEVWSPLLPQNKDKYERNQVDTVEVMARPSITALTQCRVWREGKDRWFCDRVVATRTSTGETFDFACGEWVPAATGMESALLLTARRAHAPGEVVEEVGVGVMGGGGGGEGEGVERAEGSGKEQGGATAATTTTSTTATATPTPTTPAVAWYAFHVRTRKGLGAGTDANVCLILRSTSGASWRFVFPNSSPEGRNYFEAGQEDVIQMAREEGSLGDLSAVVIWLGRGGSGMFGDAWKCEAVEVRELATGRTWRAADPGTKAVPNKEEKALVLGLTEGERVDPTVKVKIVEKEREVTGLVLVSRDEKVAEAKSTEPAGVSMSPASEQKANQEEKGLATTTLATLAAIPAGAVVELQAGEVFPVAASPTQEGVADEGDDVEAGAVAEVEVEADPVVPPPTSTPAPGSVGGLPPGPPSTRARSSTCLVTLTPEVI